jgi:hypothetical protein
MDIKSIASLITEDIDCNSGLVFSEDMAQKFRILETHINDMNGKALAMDIAEAFEEDRTDDAMELIKEARGLGWKSIPAAAAMGLSSLLGGQAAAEEPKGKPEVEAPAPKPAEVDLATVYKDPKIAAGAEKFIKTHSNKYQKMFTSAGVEITDEEAEHIKNITRKVLQARESKDPGSTLGGEKRSAGALDYIIGSIVKKAYVKLHGDEYKKARGEKKGEAKTEVSTYEGPASERPKGPESKESLIKRAKRISNLGLRRQFANNHGLSWEDVKD